MLNYQLFVLICRENEDISEFDSISGTKPPNRQNGTDLLISLYYNYCIITIVL